MIEYNVSIKWGKYNETLKQETNILYETLHDNDITNYMHFWILNLWAYFIFKTISSIF